jgi:hypothetical protein
MKKTPNLARMAEQMSREGHRGWLTPEGEFFAAEESPVIGEPGRFGGHEQAALDWILARSPALEEALERHIEELGFACIEETAGENVIKPFMAAHGFHRVAPM